MFTIPGEIPQGSESLYNIWDMPKMYQESRILINQTGIMQTNQEMEHMNPYSELLLALLSWENKESQIFTNYKSLTKDAKNIVLKVSPDHNRNSQPSLNIVHIKRNVTLMEKLDYGEELHNIEQVLKKSPKHRIKVFRRNQNEINIFTNIWDWGLQYKCIALMPRLLSEALPIVSEELEKIMLSICNNDLESLIDQLAAWETINKIKQQRTSGIIAQFLDGNQNTQKETITRRIRNNNEEIENLERRLNDFYVRQQQETALLIQLDQIKDSSRAQELEDYLNTNTVIANFEVGRYNTLQMKLQCPIKYIDVDALQKCYLNKETHFSERINQLLTDTFIDEKINIWTQAYVKISLQDREISRLHNDEYDNDTYYHQPHIMTHNCWGNNGSIIRRHLTKGDVIAAIEQAISACYNLNFLDSTVVEGFIRRIQRRDLDSIEIIATGEFINFREYCNRKENNTL